MHEVYWIRHAESTANVVARIDNQTGILLTPRGYEQAASLAQSWNSPPELIVTSPYIRTQLTAQPLCQKFPQVPVTQWNVQEFTYLTIAASRGTTMEERRSLSRPYWDALDPALCLGEGGESFIAFQLRIIEAVKLAMAPRRGALVIFTHNRVLLLVMQLIISAPTNSLTAMRKLQAMVGLWDIPNCGILRMVVDGKKVTIGRAEPS